METFLYGSYGFVNRVIIKHTCIQFTSRDTPVVPPATNEFLPMFSSSKEHSTIIREKLDSSDGVTAYV